MYNNFSSAINSIGFQDATMSLSNSAFLGFDTETTGLNAQKDSIVSASLVLRYANKNTHDDVRYECIIKPFTQLNTAAAAVNGFTQDYLQEHGEDGSTALEEILKIIAKAQNNNIPLLAYNAPFDVSMLQENSKHYNLIGLGARLRPATKTDLLIADPLVMDRVLSKRPGRRNLSTVSNYYGVIPEGNFHNALADTVATTDLMQAMVKNYTILQNLQLKDLMTWERTNHKQWAQNAREHSTSNFSPSLTWL